MYYLKINVSYGFLSFKILALYNKMVPDIILSLVYFCEPLKYRILSWTKTWFTLNMRILSFLHFIYKPECIFFLLTLYDCLMFNFRITMTYYWIPVCSKFLFRNLSEWNFIFINFNFLNYDSDFNSNYWNHLCGIIN